MNKKVIKGFTPMSHQRAVIDLVNDHPVGATIVVKSSRQKGKTLLLTQLLLQKALQYSNTNSVLISPTNASCRRILKEMESMIGDIPIVKNINYQFYELELINGSSINFKSAESEDNLRGISLKKNSLLCFDESAFISQEVFGIVLPFANVHNNTKIVVSTPKFKNGQFYKFYEKALNGDKNFYLVDFNEYDTSKLITEEQLEDAKASMPYNLFLNEYMGEFLAEQGNVFGAFGKVISNSINENNKEFFIGVDWSQNIGNDFTAITVFNSDRQQVKLRYFNEKGIFETIEEIIKIVKEYNPKRITVESNSMGETNFQILKREMNKNNLHNEVSKFTTTNQSKRKIIEDMAVMIEQGDVQFLDDTEMKLELACYEMESTKSGKSITYNASKNHHDDLIMSSAICLNSINKTKYVIL